jgi:hypothetical protein
MPELLFDRQRAALNELWRLVEERRVGEDELAARSQQEKDAAVDEGEAARQALEQKQAQELAELVAAFQKEQVKLTARQAAQDGETRRALLDERRQLDASEREKRSSIEGEMADALEVADSLQESGQKRIREQLESVKRDVADCSARIDAVWEQMDPLLARVELGREDVEPETEPAKLGVDAPADHLAALVLAEGVLHWLKEMRVFSWITWPAMVLVFVAALAVCCLPALLFQPWLFWLLGGAIAGVLLALGYRALLLASGRRRLLALGQECAVHLAAADHLAAQSLRRSEDRASAERAGLARKHTADRQKARAEHEPLLQELTETVQIQREALEQRFQKELASRRQSAGQELKACLQRGEEARANCLSHQEQERRDAEAAHAARLRSLEQSHIRAERELHRRWESGATRLLETLTDLQRLAKNGEISSAPSTISRLPFGTVPVDLPRLAGAIPVAQLAPLPPGALEVPAFLPFPQRGGLLLQASGAGRAVAVQTLQALMLRLLMALPPGKVRFTIIDPVGLGDNFAAFMHLADHDEALVTSRIWTEPSHIEKQLAMLSEHMENVIQKYLRSQFQSIEDYNERAGEVAEPYRVLVIANFPVNFTPQVANRLVSIVQSGSRCGVYALIARDTKQALPQGFRIEDLQQLCFNLYWRDERFQWGDSELDRYPLALDTAPEASRIIETVRRIGEQSRDASRVRVPFSFIAPDDDLVWKSDSRSGVTVPLGRAGAVRRLSLQLGQGTSQHVLVAGKTGSGKSTLWHALITNLALLYGPDEVELYLIDFKKGVEFKAYAVHQLPHARVIAVESEREFGLSVLQRLDAELRHRGDLFRAAGVNDLAGHREARPQEHCPRILLIVDEFQEFFVEDDRLSQEAALLLDRLVRQGRAFGLHVLLGSQTLGGAYSLARSTIDQMAVRIALQCSEADAQLILNKDNSAARLLSRPGEAIYNDTNGTVEGNEVFQIVWLPEEQRVQTLQAVRQRAVRDRPDTAGRLPLVFEGNTPAELSHNPLLRSLLDHPKTAKPAAFGTAWLGEAIAIKDPTAAVFRAQTGHHLLMVGQHEEAALALLVSALISLGVQDPAARFLVVDGTEPHEPNADYFRAVATGWPQPVEWVERTRLGPALAALAEEMSQRLKGASADRSARYLLINGLHRYRELRRSDDDVGFGRRGTERTVSPSEHLQALLRDGPMVRVHLLIWCDALANVMRALDRQGLRECGQRVLFQMSAADSSQLLDTPIATRLGRNRALYSTEEMAQPEKFRPYGLPSLTWLAEVKRQLQGVPR